MSVVYDQNDWIGQWVSDKVGGMWIPQGSVAIGQVDDGKITAGVIFDRYNGASISSTLAISGKITRDFVQAILHYPFNVAKVNCVINVVSSTNKKSMRLTEHFGFKRVAVIPSATNDGDMVIYSLTRINCKFLKE